MEITLSFKPSPHRLTEIAKQFGMLPQSPHHFLQTRDPYFLNLHALTIERGKVGLLLGELCWDTPLRTLIQPMNTNEYWMLTFIFSEESHSYSLHNGQSINSIHAHKSTLFFSSKMGAEISWPVKKRSRFVCVSVHRHWLSKKLAAATAPDFPLMSLLQTESGICFRGIPLFEQLSAFDALFNENHSLMWPLAAEAQCYELIHDFISQLVNIYRDSDENIIAARDRKYIMDVENRYFLVTEPLPELAFLAREAHMSLSKFKRCFRLIYGSAPYEYYLNLKFNIATDLLLQNKWPVSEIAARLGYAGVASFNKLFKKKFKVSPAEFIKQQTR